MTEDRFSLSNKRLLITGASSGIGSDICIETSKCGAQIILTARNEERLNQTFEELEKSNNHSIIQADLNKSDELNDIVDNVSELDGIVLCAGVTLVKPVHFTKPELFRWVFNANFFSQAELIRLLYKKKKIKNGASIVFISSIGGTRIFSGVNCAYGSSKAALTSFMHYCALEFSNRLIRVNSISPGMIDTALIHGGDISEEQLKNDLVKYPLKRYGKTIDVVNATIFLLSDASSWITGHDLVVDGGVSINT
jgi:NAD(P)-dependent dehydrogenase (short-subunit alcohol dehydrogenase family)